MSKTLIWIIVSLLILIGVLVGLSKAGVIGKDDAIKVTTEKAAVRTITETVNASGKIYPEVEVKISSDVSGEVVELAVEEGDTVKKGQILAKIYPDIYLSQRDQAAAGVTQSQAQVANSNAQLQALKATVDQTEAAYNRQKQLLDDKVISRSEFETAQQAYLSAKANYAATEQSIKANQANVQSAMANLNSADKNVTRTTISSSMDGIVSILEVKKGERVVGTAQMTGTEMMRIADLGSITAQVDVGENDIPKVKIGDTALVEVDAYTGRKFKGVVYKIANPTNAVSSTTTTTSSTDVTNYKVHIRLLSSDYKDLIVPGKSFPFRPGMSASADIQTKTKPSILSVPLNAVTTRDSKGAAKQPAKDDDKKKDNNTDDKQQKTATADAGSKEVVFLLQKDGSVKSVEVKVGIQDLNYIEITSGLKDGDEVVTGPYNVVSKSLKDGDKVESTAKDKVFDAKKK
ncbi:efflux RND transporter periplasmic adaptor subunit [Chitinophagaceae bacterium LWZ2-11]